jgi:2-C-methyl-D-erythritol 4-phosphate cytidylyltransferase
VALRTLGGVQPAPDPDRPVWVVVVAAGGGTRYGEAKQYVELAGRRVLDWSLAAASAVADGIVAVVPEEDADQPVPGATAVVAGGATRSASVRNGLAAVPADVAVVLVHDAARPAASAELFRRVAQAVLDGADGVVPGIPVTDSLRMRGGAAVDRDGIVAVQTPQGFSAAILRDAHRSGGDASDDATLVERIGGTIVVVDGETANAKLTHGPDRAGLEATLRARAEERA